MRESRFLPGTGVITTLSLTAMVVIDTDSSPDKADVEREAVVMMVDRTLEATGTLSGEGGGRGSFLTGARM